MMILIAFAAQITTSAAPLSFLRYIEDQVRYWESERSIKVVFAPNLTPKKTSKRAAAKIDIVQASVSIAAVFPILLAVMKPDSHNSFLLGIGSVGAVAATYTSLSWLDRVGKYDDFTWTIVSPGFVFTMVVYGFLFYVFWLNPQLEAP
ncbi:hypothetical protein IV500_18160 [Paeniglutamicibacter antarcticus]|uniref:Uncharacterized protein n=1 Tax=Arthrobacter terrae TaxID=2935737 RepID=A0A931CWN4_9MICC|nr:hypothetical protein [Arthrobacter terrae]MBG0741293.1 hypothetical protein [Arthrobacter terrae]